MEVAADGPGDGTGAAGLLEADHGALSRNVSSAKTSGHRLVGIYRMECVVPLANKGRLTLIRMVLQWSQHRLCYGQVAVVKNPRATPPSRCAVSINA